MQLLVTSANCRFLLIRLCRTPTKSNGVSLHVGSYYCIRCETDGCLCLLSCDHVTDRCSEASSGDCRWRCHTAAERVRRDVKEGWTAESAAADGHDRRVWSPDGQRRLHRAHHYHVRTPNNYVLPISSDSCSAIGILSFGPCRFIKSKLYDLDDLTWASLRGCRHNGWIQQIRRLGGCLKVHSSWYNLRRRYHVCCLYPCYSTNDVAHSSGSK